MQKLVMKDTSIKKGPNTNDKLSYKELIISCMNNGPKDGFSASEMRLRLRILDVLETCENSILVLEDQDAEKLKECVKSMRWGLIHKDIPIFEDDIDSMEKVEGSKKSDGDE